MHPPLHIVLPSHLEILAAYLGHSTIRMMKNKPFGLIGFQPLTDSFEASIYNDSLATMSP